MILNKIIIFIYLILSNTNMENKPDQKVPEEQNIGQIQAERGEYHNLVDILFVLDATGSMGWCISQCKKTIKKIIKKFSQKQYNIKFAIELYRDHPPQEYSYVEKHFDLCNQEAAINIVNTQCDVAGGGDSPEAALDGLFHGLKKTSWRISTDGKTKSKRFLFHGCDAPPHGKDYGGISADQKWSKNGCPCGITRQQIKQLIFQHNVDYSLIKCGNQVDIMQSLFKQAFGKHFKRVIEIQNAKPSHKKSKSKAKKVFDEEDFQKGDFQVRAELRGSIQQDDRGSIQQDECVQYKQQSMKQVQKCEKKQKGFFASLKQKIFPSKKKQEVIQRKQKVQKKSIKKKVLQQKKPKFQSESGSDSSDEAEDKQVGGIKRKRSMASLVCSEVQSGVEDYFEQDKKQEIKQKKIEEIKVQSEKVQEKISQVEKKQQKS